MKRLIVLAGILGVLASFSFCASHMPPIPIPGLITIYAQSLPATVHANWTPNAATENVTQYQVTLDTGPAVVALPTVCTATTCITTLTVPSFACTPSPRSMPFSPS